MAHRWTPGVNGDDMHLLLDEDGDALGACLYAGMHGWFSLMATGRSLGYFTTLELAKAAVEAALAVRH